MRIEDLEEISGNTHGFPALVATITDEPLFFKDEEGNIESVDDHEEGIDFFYGKKGCFLIRKGHKSIAERKIRLHDEFGIDW